MLKVVKFNGRYDNDATKIRELTWEIFCTFLQNPKVTEKKWGENNDNALFSPVEYATRTEHFKESDQIKKIINGVKLVVGKIWKNVLGETIHTDMQDNILRCNENVRTVYMAVFDYDSKPGLAIQPGDIMERVKEYNYAIYSTHSSTKDLPRFRLLLPFLEPLTYTDFKKAWPFGFTDADASCKDPARMYLMPTVPPDRVGESFFYSQVNKPYFRPKIPDVRDPNEKKKRSKLRGDYTTMDALAWFSYHQVNTVEHAPDKYYVVCPWKDSHTDGKQGETDTVLWTERGKWPTFHCSHNSCSDRDITTLMALWGDADKFCATLLTPDKVKSEVEIKALGHDDLGRYFYQCNTTNHIVPLKASEHKELNFYSVTANPHYWYQNFGDPETGKVDWRRAARELMGQCHKRGFFRPSSVRGGGVWYDEGRLVVHLGRKLLVDGVVTSIFSFKSDYVYEAMVKDIDLPAPGTSEDMRRVYDLIARLTLASKGQNIILSGLIFCGWLSGVLKWRPHGWLIGNPGTGKTAVLRYVVSPLWLPMGGVYCEGSTTEAGLRQVEIRHNAVPVCIDESEANGGRENDRVAGIIRLARSSSSDSTASVVKGSTSAVGHTYNVRSVFMLCSIAESLEHEQDRERFSVLQVVRNEESQQMWPGLRAELEAVLTKSFVLSLYSKAVALVPVLLQNETIFHQLLAKNVVGSDPRWCDQMGSVLAGAWTMATSRTAEESEAITFFQGLKGVKEAQERKAEGNVPNNALSALFAYIPLELRKPIGEVVQDAMETGSWEDHKEANQILGRYGLKVDEKFLLISSNHSILTKIFKELGYSGHYNLLSRIEGSVKAGTTRFGMMVSRAIRIPLPKEDENVGSGTGSLGSRAGQSGTDGPREPSAADINRGRNPFFD